jgi:oxygen-independent coproporphyrinogen III oxidase
LEINQLGQNHMRPVDAARWAVWGGQLLTISAQDHITPFVYDASSMSLTVLSITPPKVEPLDPRTLPQVELPALYVHIPFCFHKCHYCDFYSITRQTPERMRRFVELVLRELDQWREAAAQTIRPRTIFFGGGTPSLLPLDEMSRLIAGMRERLDLSQLDEFTIEVNPATTSLDYLQMLHAAGVDRISMGAQSFDRAELKMLERHHDPHDVERSVALARDASFERINVDLIYAIPGQTLDSWRRSLDRALALNLPHYSAYNLTYEPNTPMAVKQRLGRIATIEEEIELEMLNLAREKMSAAGRPPYEISNYASSGEACRHNLAYWTGESYLGIGPSAASHVDGVRFKNRPHLGEWERAVDAGGLPATDIERLSSQQREGEFVMLGLRLAGGVDATSFETRFGRSIRESFGKTIDELTRLGVVECGPDSLQLTPAGLPVADAVAAEFLR